MKTLMQVQGVMLQATSSPAKLPHESFKLNHTLKPLVLLQLGVENETLEAALTLLLSTKLYCSGTKLCSRAGFKLEPLSECALLKRPCLT